MYLNNNYVLKEKHLCFIKKKLIAFLLEYSEEPSRHVNRNRQMDPVDFHRVFHIWRSFVPSCPHGLGFLRSIIVSCWIPHSRIPQDP